MFRSGLSKLISLFCILVFITFLVNHGHIDFSAIDWTKDKAVEVVTSPEGQEVISETADISKNIFLDLLHAIDRLFAGDTKTEDAGQTASGNN